MSKLRNALLGVIIAGGLSGALISTASAATPRTVSGPCPTEFVVTMDHIVYPLDHGVYPGIVAVDITMVNGIPRLRSVCLEDGWTEQWKDATKVQLAFFYQGTRAIDFKFEPGKTDIRFR